MDSCLGKCLHAGAVGERLEAGISCVRAAVPDRMGTKFNQGLLRKVALNTSETDAAGPNDQMSVVVWSDDRIALDCDDNPALA